VRLGSRLLSSRDSKSYQEHDKKIQMQFLRRYTFKIASISNFEKLKLIIVLKSFIDITLNARIKHTYSLLSVLNFHHLLNYVGKIKIFLNRGL
jgi:hypothetical protein